MIYITGDCHSDFVRFNKENFPEQREMTKDDYVIICGDFGGVWNVDEESKRESWWMDWKGGKVHKVRPSVIHLMRGQVYQIDGKKIFTFGGASSHDISGGILEPDDPDYKRKKKELDHGWLPYRINRVSWWKQELPSKAEMEEGLKNLSVHGNTVDFIVSHCCSSSTQALLGGGLFTPDVLTNYLEQIRQTVTFKKWF
ncbi:MAG: metallophosphatase, partial [Lachnospiraceae bacterium]|nr:metallophosphatase [Lachnospiraceae bacterium]